MAVLILCGNTVHANVPLPVLRRQWAAQPWLAAKYFGQALHNTWDKTSWAMFLFACTPHILYFLYSAYGFRLDVQVTVHSFQYIQYRLIFKIYYYVLRSFSLHGLDIYFCEHYYSFSSRFSMVHVAVSIFQNLQYSSAAALPLWLLSISAKVQQCEKNAIASADKFLKIL